MPAVGNWERLCRTLLSSSVLAGLLHGGNSLGSLQTFLQSAHSGLVQCPAMSVVAVPVGIVKADQLSV